MKHVAQLDRYGCGVACLAMIFGISYKNTLKLIADIMGRRDYSEDGMQEQVLDCILNECGFAIVRIHQRVQTRWPVKPFADVHICIVACEFQTSDTDVGATQVGCPHAIVMDAQGRVYDPANKDRTSLDCYDKTIEIMGIFKLPHNVWQRYCVRILKGIRRNGSAKSRTIRGDKRRRAAKTAKRGKAAGKGAGRLQPRGA